MVRRSYGSTGGRGNSFPFSVVSFQFRRKRRGTVTQSSQRSKHRGHRGKKKKDNAEDAEFAEKSEKRVKIGESAMLDRRSPPFPP